MFDFDEWPATSIDTRTIYRPYNKNIFKLRQDYREVFPDLAKAQDKIDAKKKKEQEYENSFNAKNTALALGKALF